MTRETITIRYEYTSYGYPWIALFASYDGPESPIDAMPEAAVMLAEVAFETYGWPADDLDTAWLDEAGRIVWDIFGAYRVGAA